MKQLSTLLISLLFPLVAFTQEIDSRQLPLLAMGLMNTCLAQDPVSAKEVLDRMVVPLDNQKFWGNVPTEERESMKKYQSSFSLKRREQQYNLAITTYTESEWAICVQQKQWLSKELCEDFLPYFKKQDFENLAPVFEKHINEIKSKAELFTYTNKSFDWQKPAASCSL